MLMFSKSSLLFLYHGNRSQTPDQPVQISHPPPTLRWWISTKILGAGVKHQTGMQPGPYLKTGTFNLNDIPQSHADRRHPLILGTDNDLGRADDSVQTRGQSQQKQLGAT